VKLHHQDNNEPKPITTVAIKGERLRLNPWSPAVAYEARVTKIKIAVQFVQICLRLTATYRFPLPPLTLKFLESLQFFECFDIAQIPAMTFDCLKHIDYIEKTYMHTLVCLTVMLLLFNTKKLGKWLDGRITLCNESIETKRAHRQNVASDQKLTAARAGKRKRCAQPWLSRVVFPEDEAAPAANDKDGEDGEDGKVPEEYSTAASTAARKIQRATKVRRNINHLRKNLLAKVARGKRLKKEDFLLLFSFAMYTSLCDTCFMFFDCTRYEDGETYLTADPSIKCKGDEAGRWGDSLSYVVAMSVLFPLGIPLYYLIALRGVRNHINPPMSSILKDKDYVSAYALYGVLKYTDKKTGTKWKKMSARELDNYIPQENELGWVKRFRNKEDQSKTMTAEEQTRMTKYQKEKWVRKNPILAKFLGGKDYKSQFETKRTQVGYRKARAYIKSKARGELAPSAVIDHDPHI
jgi:hypothetical protein